MAHASYDRLLEAAARKPFLAIGPAAVARLLTENGLMVSSAQMGNWKSRGVPPRHVLQVSKMLHISPDWLLRGVESASPAIYAPPSINETPVDPITAALAFLDGVSPAKANLFRAQILAAEEDARREHYRVSDPPPIIKKA